MTVTKFPYRLHDMPKCILLCPQCRAFNGCSKKISEFPFMKDVDFYLVLLVPLFHQGVHQTATLATVTAIKSSWDRHVDLTIRMVLGFSTNMINSGLWYSFLFTETICHWQIMPTDYILFVSLPYESRDFQCSLSF